MLDFDKTELLSSNTLMITNEDDTTTFIPEEGATESEQAMFEEFRAKYPDGKPVIPVEPQPPIPTDVELLKQQLLETQSILVEMQYNNLLKENGGM